MNIGFFDSGIGGLSVLREALMLLPNENYIYYADSDNAPYGTKTREEVKRLTFDAVKFLNERKIKALVIACNTATSAAVRDLRKAYNFPVIGMEPAVKPAVQMNNNGDKRVLVLATALTLKEEKFQNLISRFDSEHIVDMLPAPKLVEFAEKFIFYGPEVSAYIKEIMPENIDQYGTLVLGCTHFPFFKQALEESIPGSINIIDGNRGTVNHLMSVIKNNNLLSPSDTKGKVTFYKSGVQVKDQTILERYKNILYDTKAEKHTF
ncbi:MAG: glutamate racemase [Clostridiaceae bacterium]|jgi:glutamate racemase|nr:glutamate racemase [Clostridiaceae bacterium]